MLSTRSRPHHLATGVGNCERWAWARPGGRRGLRAGSLCHMKRMVAIVAALALAAGCSDAEDGRGESNGGGGRQEVPTSPLDQMVVAFSGAPTEAEVKSAMDAALRATGETANDDTYSRAGSTLVTLRQEYGVSEMRILACIPDLGNAAQRAMSFPDAASLCVAELATQ